jgi:REP element-mobilizing transposase RayT
VARQARRKSQSGIYHVILRGINKQVIFEDDEDREKFIECLRYYKDICLYRIYGYCLMDNHIHLLITESKEDIGKIMKRIGVRYVSWYNRKYNRCGHLFRIGLRVK